MAFTIFDRTIVRGNPDEDLQVILSCEKENQVDLCLPQSVEITESVGMLSPIMVVTFKDMNGDLFNHLKIDESATWVLELKRTFDEFLELRLKISKIEAINGVIGRPMDMSFKLHFMAENWYDVLAKVHNRGWSETPLHEVIQEIVDECDFNETEIHEISNEDETFVQPYCNNMQFLKWCQGEAFHEDNDGFYVYGVNTSNNFFFLNTETHLENELVNIKTENIPKFIMRPAPSTVDEIKREKSDNEQIPAYFYGIELKEQYSTSVTNAVSGVKAMWYDFETGEYHKEQTRVRDLEASQLSDYTVLREEHSDNNIKYFGGRDVDTQKKANSYLNRQAQNIARVNILTTGSILLSIFDFIELNIPNTVYDSNLPMNMIMSGIYMVHGITHRIGFTDNAASLNTTIELERHGVDNQQFGDFSNLEDTARGKI